MNAPIAIAYAWYVEGLKAWQSPNEIFMIFLGRLSIIQWISELSQWQYE